MSPSAGYFDVYGLAELNSEHIVRVLQSLQI